MSKLAAELDEAFNVAGLRPTAQRYAVLQFLAKSPIHATADEIFAAVNRHDPRASRATVYNNLRSLANCRTGARSSLEGQGRDAIGGRDVRRYKIILRGACARCGTGAK
jgi:Fe2+ or Zn2+ uptake regulation protein